MKGTTRISRDQLDGEYRSVGLFVDNAKTYIQLATGALVLSVTFSQGLTGDSGLPVREIHLWVSWLAWLLAILAGVTYHYCAAKYLEGLECMNGSLFYGRADAFILFRRWARSPYQLYGALLVFFYGGTIWFAVAAVVQLFR